LIEVGTPVGALVQPALYLRRATHSFITENRARLALKLFRGEPAITGFD
jgi:hypothetical protein